MKYTLIDETGQYALILRGKSMTQYAVVRGPFFLCGAPEDSNYFISLTSEQLQHYSEVFALPEMFLNLGGRTIILPCREEYPL